MRAKNNRTRVLIPAALAWLVLSSTACSHTASQSGEPPGAVAEVTLTQITRADVSQILNLTGTIAALPNRDVRVSSLVPGRVAEMKVAEGDRVRAGQLVAQIDDRPIRDQLACVFQVFPGSNPALKQVLIASAGKSGECDVSPRSQ